jgi:hypothetical protein
MPCLIAACAAESKPPYVKNGKEYGVTRGFIWRPTWWNHYERGVSYAEGGYWEDAVEDLIQAIRLRDEDQRRARTYGMHFVDYFPHRELGIVYHRQTRYAEAITELERSLATEESAKAEYYLNRARKAWLERTGADRTAPTIDILQPSGGLLTQDLTLQVQGLARDDQFVFEISVNGRTIPIFLAEKEIPFSVSVPLNPGPNRVEVVARDLVGREALETITVRVDRAGPVLFLEPIEAVADPQKNKYRVKGEVRDATGIASIMIEGMSVVGELGKRHGFEKIVEVPPDQTVVEIVSEDLAGNVTHGEVPVFGGPPFVRREPVRLAWSGKKLSDATLAFATSSAKEPRIILKDIPDSMTLYYESLYLEGSVTGPVPIQSIEIDGHQLLDRTGRNIFFSYLIGLEEGKNPIYIAARDVQGIETTKTLSVFRKIPRILGLEERMRLSLLPFPPENSSAERAGLVTENLLVALIRQGRFHMVERERLADVLNEMKLATSQLTEEKTAVRVGRILAADGAVVGDVFETPRTLETVARVVDTETSEVMVTRDAFSEDKSMDSLRAMMEGLAYKLKQGLPLLEGTVLRCEGDCLYLNLGKDMGVLPEQKCVVFREGPEIRHPVTNLLLGREIEVLAEGRIREVFDAMCSASVTESRTHACQVQPSDQVITK